MRLFVALDLDDARDAFRDEQRRLAIRLPSRVSLKWTRPDQAHLTLAFLGEVAEPTADRLVHTFTTPFPIAPFDLVFDHVGMFPPRGEPRVLWVGAWSGAAEVARLHGECATRIRGHGLTLDERPFHAHVTLGRFRAGRRHDAEAVVDRTARRTIATVRIDHVTLYQSRLSAAGPTYVALARSTLT